MAVFILAVIVNSYNTGQVCVCNLAPRYWKNKSSCLFVASPGPAVLLERTLLAVVSVLCASVPQWRLFITASVTSAGSWSPGFNPSSLLCVTANQTSRRAMSGWRSGSFHRAHAHTFPSCCLLSAVCGCFPARLLFNLFIPPVTVSSQSFSLVTEWTWQIRQVLYVSSR